MFHRPMLEVCMEVLMHTDDLNFLAIRIQHASFLTIISRATLCNFPLSTSSNFEILAASFFDKNPAEASSYDVKAHEDEKSVGANVFDHVGTREREAER